MTSDGLVLDEAGLFALWSIPPHLVRRPDGVPGRVTAATVPWEQRTLRRAVGMHTAPEFARLAGALVSETCAGWPVADLDPIAAECGAALVAALAAGTEAVERKVHLLLSVAGSSLIIEVCEPDPRGAPVDEWWQDVRARVVEAGGEFGVVCGPGGWSAFAALPLPGDAQSGAPDAPLMYVTTNKERIARAAARNAGESQ